MVREILTFTDASRGLGSVAELRGGGSLELATTPPVTEADYLGAIRVEGHETPSIELELDSAGVAVPWDYESLLLVSLYHHLERARAFFDRAGVPGAVVGRLPVHYSPRYSLPLIPLPLPLFTDNAAYAPTLDAFLIPPSFFLDDVPLVANRGVVVHEYSHAVFNRRVMGGVKVAPYLVETDWPDVARNELRSLDEGLADLFGALEVGDPGFIEPSIPPEKLDLDRNLEEDHTYDAELLLRSTGDAIGDYDPYPLGSVVASTLWALRAAAGGDVALAEVALEASAGLSPGSGFRLETFFDRVHELLPETARREACVLLHARLEAIAERLSCRLEPPG